MKMLINHFIIFFLDNDIVTFDNQFSIIKIIKRSIIISNYLIIGIKIDHNL